MKLRRSIFFLFNQSCCFKHVTVPIFFYEFSKVKVVLAENPVIQWHFLKWTGKYDFLNFYLNFWEFVKKKKNSSSNMLQAQQLLLSKKDAQTKFNFWPIVLGVQKVIRKILVRYNTWPKNFTGKLYEAILMGNTPARTDIRKCIFLRTTYRTMYTGHCILYSK